MKCRISKTWAPQVKSLVDHVTAKTLVTGSSALRIADGQDSLAGRISMIELGPLRLGEIIGVRQLRELQPFQPSTRVEAWIEKSFGLTWQAMPPSTSRFSRRHLTRSQRLAGIQSATSLARNERNSAT